MLTEVMEMRKMILLVFLFLGMPFAFAEDVPSYSAKDYSYLLGMKGFEDSLLKMHFQLYQGYVKNANLLLGLLKETEPSSYAYGALKRRFSWEWDGMRLHELYFDNLGGDMPLDASSRLYQQLAENFGSYENWKKDFIDTGSIRGIGWAILYQDPVSGRLLNVWINEHDLGHLAGGIPLLIMDVFEHAYLTQFGLDRKKYIEVFFQNIDWSVVVKRLGSGFSKIDNKKTKGEQSQKSH